MLKFYLSTLVSIYCLSLRGNLANVGSWAYQLQNIIINQIASEPGFQLIVMDYSGDGTDATKFSQQQIMQIKNSGKKAIAYISVGEAEDYRYYWQSSWTANPPSFLGPENPDWAGNYKVKFWEPQWQSIVFGYIDTLLSQGFDGIYLDIIDAYYYWQDENPQMPFADTLMIDFVCKIRSHIAQTTNDTIYIIPQNAEEIINAQNVTPFQKAAYLSAIDAIGVEDVFFPGNLNEDNAYNPDQYRITQLQEYLAAGKPVLSIEYLTNPAAIQQYVVVAESAAFIPYACTRNLDQLCEGLSAGEKKSLINSGIEIFPNPAGRLLNYLTSGFMQRKLTIKIFDPMGNLVLENEKNYTGIKNHGILDLSSLNNGIYLLEFENDTSIRLVKFAVFKSESH